MKKKKNKKENIIERKNWGPIGLKGLESGLVFVHTVAVRQTAIAKIDYEIFFITILNYCQQCVFNILLV